MPRLIAIICYIIAVLFALAALSQCLQIIDTIRLIFRGTGAKTTQFYFGRIMGWIILVSLAILHFKLGKYFQKKAKK